MREKELYTTWCLCRVEKNESHKKAGAEITILMNGT
jgi:hypothetical protein